MGEMTIVSLVCVISAEHLNCGVLEWGFLKIREQGSRLLKGDSKPLLLFTNVNVLIEI